MSIQHNCLEGGCYVHMLTPDWGFLDNAFTGNIKISDIDGIVERNGHFLMLEWKKPNVKVTTGQDIMFMNFIKYANHTVFLINGDPKTSTPLELTIYSGIHGKMQKINCDAKMLFRYCKMWINNAESKTKASA